MRTILLSFSLILIAQSLWAQQPQSWLIYFGSTQFKNSKFGIHHELQLRDHKIIGDHNQTLARVGLRYNVTGSLRATMGYAFVHTEAEGTPNNPFKENRIYQEGIFSHDVKRVILRHRVRLEERFIEDRDFMGRFRYCLFVDIPFSDKAKSKDTWYAQVYDELFLNISGDENMKAFDRNRAYVGIGYKIKDDLGIQLGYMRQHVGKNSGTNHILLSIHHQMKWH